MHEKNYQLEKKIPNFRANPIYKWFATFHWLGNGRLLLEFIAKKLELWIGESNVRIFWPYEFLQWWSSTFFKLNFSSYQYFYFNGYNDVDDFMLMTVWRCWWQDDYVGGFFNVENWSLTSQSCHRKKPFPTFVINIDVASFYLI